MKENHVRFALFLFFLGILLFGSVAPAYLSGAVVASDQSHTEDESLSSQDNMASNPDKQDVTAFSILDNLSGNATVLPTYFGEVKAVSYQGSTYLVVDEKGRNKFDSYLINMTYLYENGYLVRGDDRIGVIVQTFSLNDLPQAEGAVRNLNGMIHRMHSPHLPYLSATMPYANVQKLVSAHSVAKVWLRLKVHVTLDQSVPIIKNPTEWSSLETQLGTLVDGTGITIAIIDTGIDSTHPDVAGKVVSSISFTGEPPADGYGHGTHCASIAAGTGAASGGQYKGVAPGASLMNVKVLTNSGWGYNDWIISGIQWAVDQGAKVLSMSFGANVNGDGTDPLSTAVDWASDQGAVPVVAAGNSGSSTFTVGTPAVAKKAITVGATTKTDAIASFSSRGPTLDWRIKPDVLAPGVSIVAARAAGTTMGSPVNQFYTIASGTSMATPHVSGAAALLLQIDSSQNPEQIKARLANSAENLGLDVWVQGSGRIDCYRAATAQAKLSPSSWSFGLLTSESAMSTSVSLTNLGTSSVSFTVSTETTVEGVPTNYVLASVSNGTIDGLQALAFDLTAGPFDESTPEGWFEGWLKVDWLADPVQTLSIPYFFAIMSLLDVTVLDVDGSSIAALITAASYPGLSPATSVYSSGPARFAVKSGDYAVFAQLGWVKNDYGRMFALEELVTVPRLSNAAVSLRLGEASVSFIPTKSSAGQDLTVHAYVQMLSGGTPSGSQNIMQWETIGGRFGGDLTTDKLTLYTTTYDPADKVSINLGFYASDALHSEVHLMPFKFWNVANLPSVIAYPGDQLAVWDIFYDVPEVYPAKGLRIMNAFWFTWDYTGGFQFWSWDIHKIYAGSRSKYYLGPNVQWPWICYMPTYADHDLNFLFGPLEEIHINGWTWPGPSGQPPGTGQTGSIRAGDFEFAPYTPGLELRASDGQLLLTGDVWRDLAWPRYDWRVYTSGCGSVNGNGSPYPQRNPAYELRVDGTILEQGELSGGKYVKCLDVNLFGADWTGINKSWVIAGGEVVVATTVPALAVLSSESSYTLRLDLSSGDPDAPAITSLSYPRNYALGQEIGVFITAEDTSGIASVEVQFSYDGTTWNPATYEAGVARFTVDYDGSDSIDLLIRVTDNLGNYVEFLNRPAILNARTVLTVEYPHAVPAGSNALIGGTLTTVVGDSIDGLVLNFSTHSPSFYVTVDEGVLSQFSLKVMSTVESSLTLHPVGLYRGESVSFTILTLTGTEHSVFEFPNDVLSAPDRTVWYVLGDYVLHTRNDVKFRDSAPKHSPLVAAIATDIFASQYFYGGSTNPQNMILDTNAAYISQGEDDFGNPTGIDGPIVTIGGPLVSQTVHYYMYTTQETQLYYDSGAGAIKRRDTGATVTSEDTTATSDVFVVEAFVDAQGRVVYMFWGKAAMGTMAATCFMMEVLLKPTNPYANTSWFVVRWQEASSGASANSFPDAGDTYTVIESGPPLS